MARSRYQFAGEKAPHFMTWTVVGWLPVFTRPEARQVIYDSWNYLCEHTDFELYGFVVMENHIHLVASASNLSSLVQRSKSFTARQILDLLKTKKSITLLSQFSSLKLDHKSQSSFQFWQEGSHPQLICSEDMMRQKLEYLHNNPLKRGYVADATHWLHSSARSYAGLSCEIEVCSDW